MPQVMRDLHAQPNFWTVAELGAEPDGYLRRHRLALVQESFKLPLLNTKIGGNLLRRAPQFGKDILPQNFAGMRAWPFPITPYRLVSDSPHNQPQWRPGRPRRM